MRSNIVLAALLAGCQISVGAVAVPVDRAPATVEGGWEWAGWDGPWFVGYKPHKEHHHAEKPTGTAHLKQHKKPSDHGHAKPRPSGYKHKPSVSAKHPKPTGSYHGGHAASGYQGTVLHHHNIHRANHSASAVTWSQELADIASQIAKSCVFEHNVAAGGGGYGQNIAAGTPPGQIAKVISDEFYNGEEPKFAGKYGEANPSGFESWGHFSQLVWKDTKEVGCATQHCPGGVGDVGNDVMPYFTVCNYKPPGNVEGKYGQQIGRPLGHPTVTG